MILVTVCSHSNNRYKVYFLIWNILWAVMHLHIVFRYEASYILLNMS